MPEVKLDGKRIRIGDESLILLSGEIHYWRLNPLYWREALRRTREMGLKIVATYVCWDYHEIAADRYDFTGQTDPQRDLAGFIKLVAEEGLRLIVRPGPYIYSEWPNGGLPNRAARFHRLHPTYRRAAEHYLKSVSTVIRPHLATNGGPIIMVQAENEPDPWPQFYEDQLGLGKEPGLFQQYLRERYGAIDSLNAVWETDLTDFDQARAIQIPAINDRSYLNRFLDFYRFRQWCTTESVRWTVDQLRASGIDVPLYANAYIPARIQNWRDLEAVCDLAGPDFYPSTEFEGEVDEHRRFLHHARYTRTYSRLPYIPEFEAGIWQGGQDFAGNLPPNHYLLACLSALLGGIAGWNWYMLVNRDNWLMSPINEWGRVRPDLYETFTQITALVHRIDPSSLEKLTDTAVTIDVLHRTQELGDASSQVLDSLYRADIDYECYDVATGQLARPLLFYAGGDQLERAAQERLLHYVESGGHLVFFQNLPVQDETRSPCNLLGLARPEHVLSVHHPQQIRLQIGDETVVQNSPALFAYDAVSGRPIYAERVADVSTNSVELQVHAGLPVGTRYVVGYQQKRGEGTLTCLGVEPTPALIAAIHRWLGIHIYSQANLPAIQTALFRRDDSFYLIAVNNGQAEANALITLAPAPFQHNPYRVEDLLSGALSRLDVTGDRRVILKIARKSGTVARLTPLQN